MQSPVNNHLTRTAIRHVQNSLALGLLSAARGTGISLPLQGGVAGEVLRHVFSHAARANPVASWSPTLQEEVGVMGRETACC